jgi:hypothetical protein
LALWRCRRSDSEEVNGKSVGTERQIAERPVDDEFRRYQRGDVVLELARILRQAEKLPRPWRKFDLGRMRGARADGLSGNE